MFRTAIMAAALAAPSVFSQVSTDARPSFTVAAVKPSAPEARQGMTIQPGGRFVAAGFQLKLLILIAYHLTPFQMSGGEEWMANDRWSIEATSEGVSGIPDWKAPYIPEIMAVRLRSLLEDRFQLKTHREMRTQQVYALTINKNGSKLVPADPLSQRAGGAGNAAPQPAQRPGTFRAGPGVVIGSAVSMEQIVTYLDRLMDRPVIDQTGLAGSFDMELHFSPESVPRTVSPAIAGSAPEPRVSEDPSIFTAIQEQLGLKLESSKETVEILVIDSARRPTEN